MFCYSKLWCLLFKLKSMLRATIIAIKLLHFLCFSSAKTKSHKSTNNATELSFFCVFPTHQRFDRHRQLFCSILQTCMYLVRNWVVLRMMSEQCFGSMHRVQRSWFYLDVYTQYFPSCLSWKLEQLRLLFLFDIQQCCLYHFLKVPKFGCYNSQNKSSTRTCNSKIEYFMFGIPGFGYKDFHFFLCIIRPFWLGDSTGRCCVTFRNSFPNFILSYFIYFPGSLVGSFYSKANHVQKLFFLAFQLSK